MQTETHKVLFTNIQGTVQNTKERTGDHVVDYLKYVYNQTPVFIHKICC